MKKATIILGILVTFLINQKTISQTVNEQYEIGLWHGFRNAAISFTFDDGSPNQYNKAIPLFNEFDLNMTLFIVTGEDFCWPANWESLQKAASDGHEIGSHTVTHTSFADLNDSLVTIELRESRDKIEFHITGQQCITMAYPYCVTGNKSICEQFYSAARICSGSIESSTPRDFIAISSIICGTMGSVKTSENFISRANSAVNSNGWCVYLLHGVDDDGGWSPVTSEVLRETLQHFNDNQNDFWVDTFGNIVRYIKERNASSVTEIANQDSSITVQVSDSLDNEIFNYPISIRRPLPQGWLSASATQNGLSIAVKIVADNDVRYIKFDAIPDNGEIFISRENTTIIKKQKSKFISNFSLEQNYPNPFNPSTNIRFNIAKAGFVTLDIYNLLGKKVKALIAEKRPAGEYAIHWTARGLPSGIYFYQLKAGDFTSTKKLVLQK